MISSSPDAARFYWRGLPGEKHVRYVANSDHSLSHSAAVLANASIGLLGWYRTTLLDLPRPPIAWSLNQRGTLVVRASPAASRARLWQATNANGRDFRLGSVGEAWTSSALRRSLNGAYRVRVPPPSSGWKAYFVEVTYPGIIPQIYSTRIFVTPDQPRPFEMLQVAQASLCPR